MLAQKIIVYGKRSIKENDRSSWYKKYKIINRSYSNWDWDYQNKKYLAPTDRGYVCTPYGIVCIFNQNEIKKDGHVLVQQIFTLDFCYKGYMYLMTSQEKYSKQYMVTLAKRFAKEIVGKIENQE